MVKYAFWKVGTERPSTIQGPGSLRPQLWASQLRSHEWTPSFRLRSSAPPAGHTAPGLPPAGDAVTVACWSQSLWTGASRSELSFHSASRCHSGYLGVLEKRKTQVSDESRPPKNRENTPEIGNKLAKLRYIFFLCRINREKHGPKGHMSPDVHCSAVHSNQDADTS